METRDLQNLLKENNLKQMKAIYKKDGKEYKIVNMDWFVNSGCTKKEPSWIKAERQILDEDGKYCRTDEVEDSGEQFEIINHPLKQALEVIENERKEILEKIDKFVKENRSCNISQEEIDKVYGECEHCSRMMILFSKLKQALKQQLSQPQEKTK